MDKTQPIFDRLWQDYIEQNPQARKTYDILVKEGEVVQNDHIAFRTFDDPRINVDVLAQPFLNAGYHKSGEYIFEEKKLFAKHFEHGSDPTAPRIFISQLQIAKFSQSLQNIVKLVVDKIPVALLESEDLIYSGNSWGLPEFKVYEQLKVESEYAAWLYVYGFRANHFTVSVNALKKYNTLEKLNEFLKSNGFPMNDSGGEIKGSPEQLLEQSSTRAGKVPVMFKEGVYEIPACYYEFARRYPDKDGKLYNGFIAKSADKIFESTDNRNS
ncbi:MAG: DUF1338 domain-containing protein [Bacteroidales bacterium]|nr:DUF1338 domain-containing protein [Bacteroidales bacterium]